MAEDSNLADLDHLANDADADAAREAAGGEPSPSVVEETSLSEAAGDDAARSGSRPRFVTASFRVPTEMLEAMGESGLPQKDMIETRKEIEQTAVFEDPGVQVGQTGSMPSVPQEAVVRPKSEPARRRKGDRGDKSSKDASSSSGQLAKLAIKKVRVGKGRKQLDVPEIIEIQAESSLDSTGRDMPIFSPDSTSEISTSQRAAEVRWKGQHVIFEGKCDPKGRVRMPQEVIKELGLGAGDVVEVWVKKATF